jgi:non-heme chloroperoxidase
MPFLMDLLRRRGLRCIAYDRRGHGRSDDPGRGYDYATLADELAALLDRLELRGVTLVAHSMAGGEVVRYLTRHGDGRIARVALVSAMLPFVIYEHAPHGIYLTHAARLDEDLRTFVQATVP